MRGDLGPSIAYVGSSVSELILAAIPYTLALLVPAIVLSYVAGNRVGAMAARRKALDNTVLPASYILTATPYMWLALVLAYVFAFRLEIFPVSGAYDFSLQPEWSWEFARSFLQPLGAPVPVALPRLVRRLGDRDAEPDHLRARGRLRELPAVARRPDRGSSGSYAYRNAVLPQMSGLALALGAVVGGALVTEIVFGYPGVGSLIITAIQNRDYFLLQGIFLFIIIGVLIANFIVDIAYVIVDPRTRSGSRARSDGHRAGSRATRRHARRDRRRRRSACRRSVGDGSETLYFAFRNRKLVIGLSVVVILMLVAGDRRAEAHRRRPVRVRLRALAEPPSSEHWLGTTARGTGRLRAVRVRAPLELRRRRGRRGRSPSVIGMAVGFIAGYRGGVVDDILSMFTNVVLVIPTLAVLIIVAAYLSVRRALHRGGPDRRHLMAVGGTCDPCPDVLARVPRLRRPRAPLGRAWGGRSSCARSRRT